jgi:hypothetical protein
LIRDLYLLQDIKILKQVQDDKQILRRAQDEILG